VVGVRAGCSPSCNNRTPDRSDRAEAAIGGAGNSNQLRTNASYFARAAATASLIAAPRRSRATSLPSGPTSMICGMDMTP